MEYALGPAKEYEMRIETLIQLVFELKNVQMKEHCGFKDNLKWFVQEKFCHTVKIRTRMNYNFVCP
jgi:hypothetical protein